MSDLPPIVGYMAAVEGCDGLSTKPVRRRKPTLAAALKQADKAGKAVAGATLAADGSVTLTFGAPATADQGNELDAWMAKHAGSTEGH
jgi:hypothetical protein